MDFLIGIFKVVILGVFAFFFLKSCRKGWILESIVIASFYSTVASMVGQDTGKSIVMVVLYIICFLTCYHTYIRSRLCNNSRYNRVYVGILLLLFLHLGIHALLSPAVGHEYYNQKVLFGFIEIFIPCSLIILFRLTPNIQTRALLVFFEHISLLGAFLLLLNAYIIGVHTILSASFMTRVAIGEANVIWIGRFLSIGFLSIALSKGRVVIKILKLAILMIGMILTGSKAVLLFPIITILIYSLYLKRETGVRRRLQLLGLGVLLVLGFVTVLSYLNPLAVERRFSLESTTIDVRQNSISLVLGANESLYEYIFGSGYATSGHPLVQNYDEVAYPHNITVEVFYEFGCVGLILYYLVFLYPVGFFFRKFKLNNDTIPILVGISLMFIFFAQTSGNMVGNSSSFIFATYLFFVMSSTDNLRHTYDKVKKVI